jgi:hypothetical protein
MQVDERVRKCAAFIGRQTQRGFVADGTGFFVFLHDDDFRFDYFVTAQHLIWPNRRRKPERPPEEGIVIRVNKKIEGCRLIRSKPSEWMFPEDASVDVCAYPFDLLTHDSENDLDIASNNLRTIALGGADVFTPNFFVGDEVFIAGAFVGRVGYNKNIPIIRIGNIAAMPEEPIDFASPKIPAYLIETRSMGGTSGSPVFLNWHEGRRGGTSVRSVSHPDGSEDLFLPYVLMGMIVSMHGGNYPHDFVSEQDTDIHLAKDVEFNAGIAVALPISVVSDLLESKQAKEARMAAIQQKKRDSGIRSASARLSENTDPHATDVNPKHREDFNSLLRAAVQKPEQEH